MLIVVAIAAYLLHNFYLSGAKGTLKSKSNNRRFSSHSWGPASVSVEVPGQGIMRFTGRPDEMVQITTNKVLLPPPKIIENGGYSVVYMATVHDLMHPNSLDNLNVGKFDLSISLRDEDRRFVPKSVKVIAEVGCGAGGGVRNLARLISIKDGSYFSVDVDPNSMKFRKWFLPRFAFENKVGERVNLYATTNHYNNVDLPVGLVDFAFFHNVHSWISEKSDDQENPKGDPNRNFVKWWRSVYRSLNKNRPKIDPAIVVIEDRDSTYTMEEAIRRIIMAAPFELVEAYRHAESPTTWSMAIKGAWETNPPLDLAEVLDRLKATQPR